MILMLAALFAGTRPLAAANADLSDIVMMKQVVVEATRLSPHPWRYVSFPGYEILSQCSAGETESVARHIANSLELDRRIIPPGYWGNLPTPLTMIIFRYEPAPQFAPFVPKAIEPDPDSPDFGRLGLMQTSMGGVDTGDLDTHCVVQNRWRSDSDWSGSSLARGPIPMGLLFQLDRAVPATPPWFQYGLVGTCGLLRLRPVWDSSSDNLLGVEVAKAKWLSDHETRRALMDFARKQSVPELPPIQDLFAPFTTNRDARDMEWRSPAWMAEAALFVRWGLNQETTTFRNDFVRFLERSRSEPVTEAVFQQCFGFGYRHMQTILGSYLIQNARDPFSISPSLLKGWSPNTLTDWARDATADEIGRILGDWLRMKGESLQPTQPELSEAYLRAAGFVLEHAYRDDNGLPPNAPPPFSGQHPRESPENLGAGPVTVMQPYVVSAKRVHDSRLQAVYGLYYYDIGAIGPARALLESAARAYTPRPEVYFVLAELNRNEALARPAGANHRFSAHQVADILRPLFVVIDRWGLDARGYRLIADVWAHSAAKPTPANLNVLRDGVRRYPFDAELRHATDAVYTQWETPATDAHAK